MKTHTIEFKDEVKKLARQFDDIITYGQTTLTDELYSVSIISKANLLKSVMKELEVEYEVKTR